MWRLLVPVLLLAGCAEPDAAVLLPPVHVSSPALCPQQWFPFPAAGESPRVVPEGDTAVEWAVRVSGASGDVRSRGTLEVVAVGREGSEVTVTLGPAESGRLRLEVGKELWLLSLRGSNDGHPMLSVAGPGGGLFALTPAAPQPQHGCVPPFHGDAATAAPATQGGNGLREPNAV